MVYTVTFNPSIDYVVSMNHFEMGITNRTTEEQMTVGGKGINVSLVLKNLGIPSVLLGFTAGFTGDKIEEELKAQGLQAQMIRLPGGCSRINIKLKDYDGTEINGMGPEADRNSLDRFREQLQRLRGGDTLVFAGSVLKNMPETIYRDLIEQMKGPEIRLVVDTTGDRLLQVLEFSPFLIKPNHHELGELFHTEIGSREEAAFYAKRLQKMGALNVLVSMSSQGAVLADAEGNTHMLPAPEGKLVNAVGAGDSMVAGFLAGWEKYGSYKDAFRMGLAAGSASAFSETLASGAEIMDLFQRL